MKRVLSFAIILTVGVFLSASAYAIPNLLLNNQVNKFKFTNYENLIDNNNNGIIDKGDQFQGVLIVTDITDLNSIKKSYSSGFGPELTGYFQLTVTSATPNFSATSPPPPNATWNATFDLSSTGDQISLYYDATNQDYSAGTAGSSVAADILHATNGDLWMQTTGADYIAGGNQSSTSSGGSSSSVNFNWMNLTTNNTGYTIVPELWKETSGVVGNYGSHVSDLYYESQLSFVAPGSNADGVWQFKSEDPGYLYATPEPTTLVLFGLGLLFGAGAIKRRYVK